ncbi:MAG: aldo/keto reductase [Dehalococcoidia bacterium]|nr:aldo/keto reductase [Dehalococcoidia bacterium]
MERRPFGPLGMVSALTLGGGGTGQVWGATTRDAAVATTREAVETGIDFLDVAPGYGNGEAERVVGQAFDGRLPVGVRISTKCRLNIVPAAEVLPTFEASLAASLERLRLERVDLFILHNQLVTDRESSAGVPGTPLSLFDAAVRPAFERLVEDGRVGAWGITGIGTPAAVIEVLRSSSPPAAVQCVTNLLDSPGSMQRFEGDPRPRDIITAAVAAGVGVMGIRAVQAGALTDAFDRDLPDDHADMRDYRRAAPFRVLAAELGVTPALLAHRYALTMPGASTVVLGVKNREELRECLAALAAGPLEADLLTRIDSLPR